MMRGIILFTQPNINGNWLEPNGKGFIRTINLEGKIIHHKWVEHIEGQRGTAIHNDKLFVADYNTVIGIDRNTSKIINKHKIKGTERINDLKSDGAVRYMTAGQKAENYFH